MNAPGRRPVCTSAGAVPALELPGSAKHMSRVMLGLVVAALVGLGGSAAAGATTVTHDVPDVIKVPAGNKKIAVMPARGVQTYQCTAGAWAFLQPDAILRHH